MKIRNSFFLVACGVIGAAQAAEPELKHFENLAENPSFEEDRNRDSEPDGWRANAFDSPAQLAWDNQVARSGSRSVSIRGSHRTEDEKGGDWKRRAGRWNSPARACKPGTSYSLEVWIRTAEGNDGDACAHLAWYRDGRWLSEDGTGKIAGDSDWKKVSVTATAPEDADTMVISLNLNDSSGAAWFDDVKVSGISDERPAIEYHFHDTKDWFPFVFPMDDTNLDEIDLTGLLDAPAGRHGFVTVRDDGHFYFEDGVRARFFGTNVGGSDCAPEKAVSEMLAARLAKYGVNLLRLHAFDSQYGPIIDYKVGGSRKLNPEGLDRMDYLIAELKKRGIYVYLDLLDYRHFQDVDGVAGGDDFTHNWAGSMKGASIFDERMIELQQEYAAQLLTHRNAYTGLRYCEDPGIAVVETTNENSIFYFFRNGDLSTGHYRDELARRWNRWLSGKYADRTKLAEAWKKESGGSWLRDEEDPAKGTIEFPFGALSRLKNRAEAGEDDPALAGVRLRDGLAFLGELQRRYYREMQSQFEKIGVRMPVAGTNQMFLPLDTSIEAEMNDFVSRNQYWNHPNRNAKPFFKFSNLPLVRCDIPTERNPLSVIARTSVAGKPQGVAEFNFPWPNEYRGEGWLLSTAYACLQDWDIFLLFSYGIEDTELSMFKSGSDPVRWGTLPAAALMFHRHDVAAAKNEIHVVHTAEDARSCRPATSHAEYTNQRFLTFISKVRTGFSDGAYRGKPDAILASGPSAKAEVAGATPAIRIPTMEWEDWQYPEFVRQARELGLPGYDAMDAEEKRFRSDTGELDLQYGRGTLTIRTPHTQSAIGFLPTNETIDLGALRVENRLPFAVISATSLDGKPLGESGKVLVSTVARAENTGQAFWPPTEEQAKRSHMSWMLPATGKAPVIAEPVDAVLTLPVPGEASVFALDPAGRRRQKIESRMKEGCLVFNPVTAKSIWCLIVAEKK